MTTTDKPLCIIAGVGPGNGMAVCRKFLEEGFKIAILSRNLQRMIDYAEEHEDISPYACDLADPLSIEAVFSELISDLGAPTVVIYNAGSGLFGSAMEVSLADFEQAWKLNALGLLCVAKSTIPPMIKNNGGSLLITGATASLRGGANFAAFSSAKAAQRNLSQSLARSLGSQGIHVALLIIDGIIDMPRARELFPDMPQELFIQPSAIADTFYNLSQQSQSAWTFEMDLRPSSETW